MKVPANQLPLWGWNTKPPPATLPAEVAPEAAPPINHLTAEVAALEPAPTVYPPVAAPSISTLPSNLTQPEARPEAEVERQHPTIIPFAQSGTRGKSPSGYELIAPLQRMDKAISGSMWPSNRHELILRLLCCALYEEHYRMQPQLAADLSRLPSKERKACLAARRDIAEALWQEITTRFPQFASGPLDGGRADLLRPYHPGDQLFIFGRHRSTAHDGQYRRFYDQFIIVDGLQPQPTFPNTFRLSGEVLQVSHDLTVLNTPFLKVTMCVQELDQQGQVYTRQHTVYFYDEEYDASYQHLAVGIRCHIVGTLGSRHLNRSPFQGLIGLRVLPIKAGSGKVIRLTDYQPQPSAVLAAAA